MGCGGGGCCGIVEENGGWRVRGIIEINVRLRTLINSKILNVACNEMTLVRNELIKFLNIISKLL